MKKNRNKCTGTTLKKQPCQASAIADGYCKFHHPQGAYMELRRSSRMPAHSPGAGKPICRRKFDECLAEKFITKMLDGFSQEQVAKMPGYPDSKTVWLWKKNNPSFRKEVEMCRRELFDQYVDEMIEISDDTSIPIERARVKYEARKLAAELVNPARYKPRSNATKKAS